MKNIPYLLWNLGVWRFLHDTYLIIIEVQGILCTNHLHDSCPLTDINPHFTTPGCWYYFKINSWWPNVTPSTHGPGTSYCDVTMAHCSHGYLWTHYVEVGVSWRDCGNLRSPELFGTWLHHFAYLGSIHYSTMGDQTIYTWFWLNLFVHFTYHFRTPMFQHGPSLVYTNKQVGDDDTNLKFLSQSINKTSTSDILMRSHVYLALLWKT